MTLWRKFLLVIFLVLAATPAFARRREPGPGSSPYDPAANPPQISADKSGRIPTRPGLCLRLNTDAGNVHIFTDESAQVFYHVVVEANSSDPGAAEFLRQFIFEARRIPGGVSLEARLLSQTFPGRFGVRVDVHVPRRYDLKINTLGGNIEVQDIEGQVDVVTGGGDITIGDVSRTLRATTSGGHITTGNIGGDGVLHTGGGQIRSGRIAGVASLETGGGNIRVERTGSSITADTGGGQIDFAEALGTIRTHTGGGAVRLDRVIAPTVLETTGGGIFLNHVDAPLRVSSAEGNMIVHLPGKLAATIDAIVENGGRIVADPSLPLTISDQDSGPGLRTMRGEGDLNGGGEILHLKANSGNIILKLGERRGAWNSSFPMEPIAAAPVSSAMPAWNSDDEAAGFFEEVRRRIEESWWGGVPVDAGEMQKHLERSVAPAYPDVARSAGIEGDVTLRVYVSGEGRVTEIKVLDGPPILARAAVEAVQHWQYQALRVNGQPTSVVTTLILAFRLN